MRQIFHDPAHEKTFMRNGYVCVNLLSEAEVDELRVSYRELNPQAGRGFHSTLHGPSTQYRQAVYDAMAPKFADKLKAIFINFDMVTCSFVVKEADPDSAVIAHQDWTLVDETKYLGINAWTPLVDTTPENGMLQLIPGSHRLPLTLRGSGLPDPLGDCREKDPKGLGRYMKSIPLKAGQTIIYDAKIIHQSPPNKSTASRVACAVGLIPSESDLLHLAYESQDRRLTTYRIGSRFFVEHDIASGSLPARLLPVDIQTVETFRMLDIRDIAKTRPFWTKAVSYFFPS